MNKIYHEKNTENICFEFNDKFRIKITETCNMSCPFCHSEGTKKTEEISLSDENFLHWLKTLKKVYNKVHLTGGEPTLYSNLPSLCEHLKALGFEVMLTTNLLQLNSNLLESIPFLSKINVSLHTFNPKYFRDFIFDKEHAEKYINNIKSNIIKLKKIIKVSVNAVVSHDIRQELEQVLLFCEKNDILLKLVPDWRCLEAAKKEILLLLKENNFIEYKRIVKIPGSNLRIMYKNERGYSIEIKDIKPYYLDFWCSDCSKKNKCIEKFAFLRLEGNPLRFKVCIDKAALSANNFENLFWPEFEKLMNASAVK